MEPPPSNHHHHHDGGHPWQGNKYVSNSYCDESSSMEMPSSLFNQRLFRYAGKIGVGHKGKNRLADHLG
eukprot:scaffold17019_cov72-Skeletonema_dohrnii-CCMP3373.AAC.1